MLTFQKYSKLKNPQKFGCTPGNFWWHTRVPWHTGWETLIYSYWRNSIPKFIKNNLSTNLWSVTSAFLFTWKLFQQNRNKITSKLYLNPPCHLAVTPWEQFKQFKNLPFLFLISEINKKAFKVLFFINFVFFLYFLPLIFSFHFLLKEKDKII